MCALFQAAPYLCLVLTQQIGDELLARIVRNLFGRVHQAQGGRRYHRLLERDVRIAHGDIQITICVPPVTERSAREPRQAARMTVPERNYETIRGHVRKAMHAIRTEIMILPLFAIGNDRGTYRFKPFNGVSNRIFIERVEAGILAVALCNSFEEIDGPWDTADWLRGYRDWRRLGHTYCLAQSLIELSGVNNKQKFE